MTITTCQVCGRLTLRECMHGAGSRYAPLVGPLCEHGAFYTRTCAASPRTEPVHVRREDWTAP